MNETQICTGYKLHLQKNVYTRMIYNVHMLFFKIKIIKSYTLNSFYGCLSVSIQQFFILSFYFYHVRYDIDSIFSSSKKKNYHPVFVYLPTPTPI